MDSNKRMAFNTVVLYIKLVVTIVINLYSTRLILNALGVEDFGVVNLIAGVVAMLSFVQNSMSVSSQRYMSVNMGKHNDCLMAKVFNSSFALHLFLAVILIIILESLIPVVFSSSIQIPEHRMVAARILYQLTIIGTILVVVTVPFDAALSAHENMLLFSIVSIIESIIRLIGAFALLVYDRDKLIFYGVLLILIRLVSMLVKLLYCRKCYKETKISLSYSDKNMMKEMFFFAFWNMFGALAMTARSQGVSIVMNPFFGVVVNSAYGIANQISGQLQNFTATISKAMTPQIMQHAGSGDDIGMISLSLKQCKYTSFLLSYAAVPLFISMQFILKIWLKEPPRYCVEFCSLILIVSVIQQLTNGIMSLIQASGIIRNYQISISLILLLNIPLAYFLLRLGVDAPVVMVGMIGVEILAFVVRLLFAKTITGLSIKLFFLNVVLPVGYVYSVTSISLFVVNRMFFENSSNMFSFLVFSSLSVFLITLSIYSVLTKKERLFMKNIFKKIIGYGKSCNS